MEQHIENITIDAEILGRTPVFTHTRIPVKMLFDYLEAGDSVKRFLSHFPSVKHAQAISVLIAARNGLLDDALEQGKLYEIQ
jgi:uncharacterized protein (DUF433 family)